VVVKVEPDGDGWRAVCHTGPLCQWRSRRQVVKVAAEDEARWHRQTHRASESMRGRIIPDE
jgi:hypothetical protein